MANFLLAGLGNPSQKYEGMRHNVGYWLVDVLAQRLGWEWKKQKKQKAVVAKGEWEEQEVVLMKSTLYMNESGASVQRVASFYKIPPERTIVMYDEINLELGEQKITCEGGPGGHNGIEDIIRHIGRGFIRFRIGIGGKREPEMDLVEHVLGKLSLEEKSVLTSRQSMFISGINILIKKGPIEAMNQMNRRG